MISTPSIQTNSVGGSSSVSFTSVASLNNFIQQAASNNLNLTSMTIYSPGNFDQLSQPIILARQDISGNAKTNIKTPIVDPYQSTAVLRNVDMNGFVLDGLSSIGYSILPNTQVQFILSVTPRSGLDSTQSYKDQTNAVDTFDIIAGSGEMPQSQIFEPEEAPLKPVIDQLLEINNKTSEVGSLDQVTTKPKTTTTTKPKPAKKTEETKPKVDFIPPLVWIIPAIIIAFLLFDEYEN